MTFSLSLVRFDEVSLLAASALLRLEISRLRARGSHNWAAVVQHVHLVDLTRLHRILIFLICKFSGDCLLLLLHDLLAVEGDLLLVETVQVSLRADIVRIAAED